MNRHAFALCAGTQLCLWILLGCDAVGAPLVDRDPTWGGGAGDEPCSVLACTPPSMAPVSQGVPAALRAPITGGPCERALELDAWPVVECASLHISVDGEDVAAWVEVERLLDVAGIQLQRTHLRLASEVPISLTLTGARLSEVILELQGPVELRLRRTALFYDVQVLGTANDTGGPHVTLEELEATVVVVSGDSGAFEGTLTAVRAEIERARFEVDEVRLESVRLRQALIEARTLTAADTTLARVDVRAGQGLLSACSVGPARFSECGSLSLLATTVVDTQFAACDVPPLRLYQSTFDRCFIDGSIEADASYFSEVRFGTRQTTTLVAWDAFVMDSSFCGHANATRWGATTRLECVTCTEFPPDVREPLCVLPDVELELFGDAPCAVLQDPPICGMPWPERLRPTR